MRFLKVFAILLLSAVALADEPIRPLEPNPLAVDWVRMELFLKGLTPGLPVFLRVFKQKGPPRADLIPEGRGYLELWMQKEDRFVFVKRFPIDNFSGKLGPKLHEGDLQAIEGVYTIIPEALNNETKFHLSLNTGYPNLYDQENGRTGSFILLHGKGKSTGCYAFSDWAIDQIYYLVREAFRQGTQSEVQLYAAPFPLTDENLAAAPDPELKAFWSKLALAQRYFERTHTPPITSIENSEYVFYDLNGNNLQSCTETTTGISD